MPSTAPTTLLPLRTEAKPAFEWSTILRADAGAGPNARLRVRPWLTVARWQGDVDVAARVAAKLVDNAVRHGKPLTDGCVSLHLIVTPDTHELLIEVDDDYPEFPDFEKAATQSRAVSGTLTGLGWVTRYQGRLSWDVRRDAHDEVVGKTVQAVLPAG
ncbi:ATP-binding protein [Streptomyces sp. NPDC058751]|uniref:ATP-binding protein n=1 Tax=Streptomyces sp. NPDC058751 TaxID=3346623 RepID=UPI0036C83418